MLLTEEINEECQAVADFLKLSVICAELGETYASEYFLTKAQQDVQHVVDYAKVTTRSGLKYNSKNLTIEKVVKQYLTMEQGGLERIVAIMHEINLEVKLKSHALDGALLQSAIPELDDKLIEHAEEIRIANLLLDSIQSDDYLNTNHRFKLALDNKL